MSPTAGQFVTETCEYDGGRQVTVYVPPDPADAIVFAGDGGWHISRLGGALDAATARCTMVVGVHGLPDDDGRLKEYVPGFDESRFAAHERFFVEDVRRRVRTRFGVALPAQRRATFRSVGNGCPIIDVWCRALRPSYSTKPSADRPHIVRHRMPLILSIPLSPLFGGSRGSAVKASGPTYPEGDSTGR